MFNTEGLKLTGSLIGTLGPPLVHGPEREAMIDRYGFSTFAIVECVGNEQVAWEGLLCFGALTDSLNGVC